MMGGTRLPCLNLGDEMRLGSVTLSATVSALLLSGCSFIGGQSYDPYANTRASQYGQHARYGQAATRPKQVSSGVNPQRAYGGQNYGTNGFPQQPQFGQPQYTNGGYGSAVGQSAALSYHTPASQKRKPRLRGSLSIGVEKSSSGSLIDSDVRGLIGTDGAYNPQAYNEGFTEGSRASGSVTTTTYTANDLETASIFAPFEYETANISSGSFNNAWLTPAQIKGGVEYILNDKMTVFANGGYTYSEGNDGEAVTIDATLYRQTSEQPYVQEVDDAGDPIIGSYIAAGEPLVNTSYIPNQHIATLAYEYSDLEQIDLEVGGRYYFDPLVKSEGYRTLTPFVGASVGVSHVNAVDVSISQRQAFYTQAFNGSDDSTYSVPTPDEATRIYDSAWLPQGQLNVGAEWQITPKFALAAETGVKVQGARDYADFANAAGETISGESGDTNISIPLTLRGSVNF